MTTEQGDRAWSDAEVAAYACAVPALFVVDGQGIAYGTWGPPDFVCMWASVAFCERAVEMRDALRMSKRLGSVNHLLGPLELSEADAANYHQHQQMDKCRRYRDGWRCLRCGAPWLTERPEQTDSCWRCIHAPASSRETPQNRSFGS